MSRQENNIENDFIRKLEELGYQYRPDIKDNITLNQNFREKFETLNHVKLTDNEFKRILEQIIIDLYPILQYLRAAFRIHYYLQWF
jgi:type I restriction enzyme R subunit